MLGRAGMRDGFAHFNLCGDFLIQGEDMGEQILFRGEAVGGEDCGAAFFAIVAAEVTRL